MATDFAVYYLTQPFGLALQFCLFIGPAVLLRFFAATSFAKLGFRRLLFAQLAVAVIVFLLSALGALDLGYAKVQLGHIRREEMVSWVIGSSVYLFVLTYVFALAFASLVLLPYSIWLYRRGRATVVMLLALGVAVSFSLAALSAAFPSNDWGRNNPAALFASTLSSLGVFVVGISFAFGIGAQLPMRRATERSAA